MKTIELISFRVKIMMACVQITIMSLNIVGFIVFGREPDNAGELMKVYQNQIYKLPNGGTGARTCVPS